METQESKFHFVERKSPEIMNALTEAPICKKQGRVEARPATPGEEITTTLEGGAKETVNKAGEGDWIMTNPGGEQYIISEKKFLGRYEATDEEGVYAAKGSAVLFRIRSASRSRSWLRGVRLRPETSGA